MRWERAPCMLLGSLVIAPIKTWIESRKQWNQYFLLALCQPLLFFMSSSVLLLGLNFDDACGIPTLERIREFYTAYAKKQGFSIRVGSQGLSVGNIFLLSTLQSFSGTDDPRICLQSGSTHPLPDGHYLLDTLGASRSRPPPLFVVGGPCFF